MLLREYFTMILILFRQTLRCFRAAWAARLRVWAKHRMCTTGRIVERRESSISISPLSVLASSSEGEVSAESSGSSGRNVSYWTASWSSSKFCSNLMALLMLLALSVVMPTGEILHYSIPRWGWSLSVSAVWDSESVGRVSSTTVFICHSEDM